MLDSYPNSSSKAAKLFKLSQKTNSLELLERAIDVAKTIQDSRVLTDPYLELAKFYFLQKNYQKANNINTLAILAAESSISSKNLFYGFKQRGEIQISLGNKTTAIDSYSRALSNLQSDRGLIGNNLLFQLREDTEEFLREYVTLLLESNRPDEAIEILSILKLVEFQKYYNDPCLTFSPDIQSEIREKERAIVYSFIGKNLTYLIVKLPNEKPVIRTSSIDSAKLNSKAISYREQIKNSYSVDYRDTSQIFHDLLINPLEADLKGIKRVTFIQDGILRNIPMESLNDGRQYLIEKYAIDYRSGLSATPDPNSTSFDILLAGASQFTLPFEELPFVKEEINFLEKALINPLILLNRDFTSAKFKKLLKTRQYYLIHIATHGFFGGNAENSYLLAYDAKISLAELNDLFAQSQTPPYLLFLSGCDTAAGNSSAPLGISGTALKTGTKNVVASLWNIEDDSTQSFVQDFYFYFQQGYSLTEAKQMAQINKIKEHVSVWSAFTIYQ